MSAKPVRFRGTGSPTEVSRDAEWLVTGGCSAFGCGTVDSRPARRFHGWLIAPVAGSAKRHSFVAGAQERVRSGEDWLGLTPVDHAGGSDDEAAPPLVEFADRPWPTADYTIAGGRLRRELAMHRTGADGVVRVAVRYTWSGAEDLSLEFRPMLTCREFDSLTFCNDVLDERVESRTQSIRVRPYAVLPAVTMAWSGAGSFTPSSVWRRGIRYAVDLDRGYDGHEDHWSPGVLAVTLTPGTPRVVEFRVDPADRSDEAESFETSDDPGAEFPSEVPAGTDRAEDFLFRAPVESGGTRTGILAGFPWFDEWGRDVFIALPGLTLARGRIDRCAEVLDGALAFLHQGLLPNIYGLGIGDSHYGSVDAALWFARAVRLWRRAAGEGVGERYLEALLEIATCYHDGSAGLGIAVVDDLLRCGAPHLNPTWMDAQTAAGPVTPREGSPVEICALWCALLADLAEQLARADRPEADLWRQRADRSVAAFQRAFWLDDVGYFADVVRDGVPDRSIRPNMVLAAALENGPVRPDQRRSVVELCRRELLTSQGLRTLSPSDANYRAHYGGGVEERDGAYHQGTVWPWLLGFFTEAAWIAGVMTADELRACWVGVAEEAGRAGLGHVSEVFDGELPHAPGGTFAQAWNTAEWLRAEALLDAADTAGRSASPAEAGESVSNRVESSGSFDLEDGGGTMTAVEAPQARGLGAEPMDSAKAGPVSAASPAKASEAEAVRPPSKTVPSEAKSSSDDPAGADPAAKSSDPGAKPPRRPGKGRLRRANKRRKR